MALSLTPIPDQRTTVNAGRARLSLFNYFDDRLTTGKVATFRLYDTSLAGGVTRVVLFDQAGQGAPQTVQNFETYVTSGAYTNTIIHRALTNFVVQGGGFTLNTNTITAVPANPPVQNEFSSQRSNLRGTIAMAKVPNNPNSATSEWFFNLSDDNAFDEVGGPNLDSQNGGFTVFGQVASEADMAVVDAIAALPRGTTNLPNVPLIVPDPTAPAEPQVTSASNFVRYQSISITQEAELTFRVVSNSNRSLVTAAIDGGRLVLDYVPNRVGEATIQVEGTNLLGQTISDTFSVRVTATTGADTLVGTSRDEAIAGLGGNDRISGAAGEDVLRGDGGNDLLRGQDGDDVLFGGRGDDRLEGGEGNDRLHGEAGRDRIITGAGRDVIVLSPNEGTDTVTDFTDRRDRLQLSGGLRFGQLTFRQQGDDTLIQKGQETLVVLEDVLARRITQADFI